MGITASDLVHLSRLLDEAMALTPPQRQAWLRALPESDRHLHDTLNELLSEQSTACRSGFMITLPKLASTEAFDETLPRKDDPVGPYRLIRELGCGGMGSVWLAIRADGSFDRHVALKLPRLMWGAGLAERMARERDIGALLEHPNIARLYDAGIDQRGRPYLAMEYVAGQPIDLWCDEQRLSVRERLQLLVQVARAVGYAHARLVVHRDLKPSNVLVTPDGQAHLLDFGIAKRLQDEGAAAESRLTKLMGRALTPRYASPEQIRDEPITVASDVYSLGVLLYELLTGSCPHSPKRGGLAALEQSILDEEPALASQRVADRLRAKALRGEVDAILAKAMKRLPQQRYRSVDAMADDIERHLHGRRVEARADSAWYRTTKAFARRRSGIAAAAVASLAMVAAAVAAMQYGRANDQQQVARIAKQVAVDLIRVGARDGRGAQAIPADQVVAVGARIIENRSAGQPRMRAELYGEVAKVLLEHGKPALAAHYAAEQTELLKSLGAGPQELAHALLLQARALGALGRDAEASALRGQAERLAPDDASLAVETRLEQVNADLLHARTDAAAQGLQLADALMPPAPAPVPEGVADGPETALQPEIGPSPGGDEGAGSGDTPPPAPTVDPKLRIDWLEYRARWLRMTAGLDEALPVYDAAIRLAYEYEGALSPRAVRIRLKLANALREAGRGEQARAQHAAALQGMRALGGEQATEAALYETAFARRMHALRMMPFEEARAVVARVRRMLQARSDAPPAALAQVDQDLGAIHARWGDVESGERLAWPAAELLREDAQSPAARATIAAISGAIARDAGRHDQADALLREAIALRVLDKNGDAAYADLQAIELAANLRMQGRFDEAETELDRIAALLSAASTAGASARPETTAALALAHARIALDRGDPHAALHQAGPPMAEASVMDTGEAALVQSAALCALGEARQGWQRFEAASAQLAEDRYPNDPAVAYWRATAGLCALDAGKPKQAAALSERAQRAFAEQPGVSDYFKAPALMLAARLGGSSP